MTRIHLARRTRAVLSGAALLAAVPLAAPAEELEAAAIAAGEVEYMSACAGCHGRDATGDGPMASLMTITTPDLTTMSERNGGTFPFAETLRMIDGRAEMRAHGSDMPVWGDRYMLHAVSEATGGDREAAALLVHGRIVSLAYYLDSIQR
ncbi:MAG: c-type cytochrome [Paracoccaceae bacterium]|jgi:mono/diheme cytochrome c family protein|nr:c-type cytochrome [Paracoccaceae bacterium]